MRRAAALVVASALLALTACTAIPTSGAVTEGDVISEDTDTRVAFLPDGPQTDATPEQILAGFMTAATNGTDNYAIARQFLSTDVRATWDPTARVAIRKTSADPHVTVNGDTASGSYDFTTVALVDDHGRYDASSASVGRDKRPFEFRKQDGQWRISALENGIVLSAANFGAVFAEYPIYFFDPTYRYLVPDERWFPQTSGIATSIARALIEGPSPWLTSAVVTAVPEGTQLDDTVTVEDGTATVNLTALAPTTKEVDKARMVQQLAASLAGGATVTSVALTVQGIVVPVESTAADQSVPQPTVGPLPLVLSGDDFGYLGPTGVSALPTTSSAVQKLRPRALAYDLRSRVTAVRSSGALYRVDASGGTRLLAEGVDLIDPSLDPQGLVWSGNRSGSAAVVAYEPGGTAHDVAVPGISATEHIVSFDLSRDGARALIVVASDTGSRVLVAGIVRQDGTPTRLGQAVELAASGVGPSDTAVTTEAPLDAAWASDTSVVTLVPVPGANGSSVTVTQYDLGGPSVVLGGVVANAVSVVGGDGGADGLRLLTTDGDVYRLRSSNWQSTGLEANVLATVYPG